MEVLSIRPASCPSLRYGDFSTITASESTKEEVPFRISDRLAGEIGGLRVALPDGLRAISGAQQLHDWFGYWPTFHDAEVISLHLNRTKSSILKVHTWEMTSEVDKTGHYVMAKDVVIDFVIDISAAEDSLELHGFSHQNVIFGLEINKDDSTYKLDIDSCYGLGGSIKADTISIRLTPGKPEG